MILSHQFWVQQNINNWKFIVFNDDDTRAIFREFSRMQHSWMKCSIDVFVHIVHHLNLLWLWGFGLMSRIHILVIKEFQKCDIFWPHSTPDLWEEVRIFEYLAFTTFQPTKTRELLKWAIDNHIFHHTFS